MLADTPTPFLFAVCQVGAEALLKKELSRTRPDLRLAFSRPGFVTLKAASGTPFALEAALDAVFARAFGVSFGHLPGDATEDAGAAAKELAVRLAGTKRARLHVWARDEHKPGAEPAGFDPVATADVLREPFLAAGRDVFFADPVATAGDIVIDVVRVDKAWWIGAHRHGPGHSPYPGGRPPLTLPADAPSRAYLKLEEALVWARAPVLAGDVALELGSAPGGASYALLSRGVSVIGVDPAAMDPRVSALAASSAAHGATFTHLEKPVRYVERKELPQQVEWLLVDLNLAPKISIGHVTRFIKELEASLLGIIVTLKLGEQGAADKLPALAASVRAAGVPDVRVAQLSQHHQEVLLYGLTKKGAKRPS